MGSRFLLREAKQQTQASHMCANNLIISCASLIIMAITLHKSMGTLTKNRNKLLLPGLCKVAAIPVLLLQFNYNNDT